MRKDFVYLTELPRFRLWKQIEKKRIPLSFDIEVTARCNNNCRHCYINLLESNQPGQTLELGREEICELAREAVSLGALWCLLTGGEPLLRDDFAEIYLDLKRLGLLVSVFTNACLITREHLKLFREYPPRDLEITVYGVTPETYEAVTRRTGSFAAFRQGLDLLLTGDLRVRLKAMALRANVHELPEIARFCRKHTRDYFRFDPFLHLRYDGNLERNEEIKSQRLTPEEIVALEQADPKRWLAVQRNCEKLIMHGNTHSTCNHIFQCGAGLGNFTVSPEGIFRLCQPLCHPECTYDLRKGNLKDAWEEMVPQVRERHSQNPEFLEKCRVCSFINLCFWCPAHAYLETGRLDSWVEDFCAQSKARAQSLKNCTGLAFEG